jgi:hypothetical protein
MDPVAAWQALHLWQSHGTCLAAPTAHASAAPHSHEQQRSRALVLLLLHDLPPPPRTLTRPSLASPTVLCCTEECELVLKTLLEQDVVRAGYFGRLAESDGMGLRADFAGQAGTLMGPASSLFWRVICEWLHSQATSRGLSAAHKVGAAANIDAAAAAEQLEALEAALPPTVADMADIVAKHAAAGARYRFSTGQLMLLAARCMDFADAAGRSAASQMLRHLLSDAPR